jgi:hypothetical protein
MKLRLNQFDKDLCLFEASGTLSLPISLKTETDKYKKIVTSDEFLVKKKFPLIYAELKIEEKKFCTFELYFIKRGLDIEMGAVEKSRSIFIFSSHPLAPWPPGSIIDINCGEKVTFENEFYANHFIGSAC